MGTFDQMNPNGATKERNVAVQQNTTSGHGASVSAPPPGVGNQSSKSKQSHRESEQYTAF